MEALDAAREAFDRLRSDIITYQSTLCTEQDARVKVIDRMFVEVLGWSLADLQTEEEIGGKFLDYRLSIGGFGRLIVEAKRDGKNFGITMREQGGHYKLNGSAFAGLAIKEGLKQCIGYCGQKNVELGCLTNGREWIVFRGSRLGDGLDTMEGVGFVFPSLDAVANRFSQFYELLSKEHVEKFTYRAHFQEVEHKPIRTRVFSRSIISSMGQSATVKQSSLAADLDRVMSVFFRRITDEADQSMLMQCFVETVESQHADQRLARIAEELSVELQSSSQSSAEQLSRIVDRVRRNPDNSGQAFVLLVGTKGAGKTTFIERFFKVVLDKRLAEKCVVVRINLANQQGDEKTLHQWLNRSVLNALENATFADSDPGFEHYQGMFFDDYSRMSKKTLKHLYEKDPAEFKIEFGKHVEHKRASEPHDYIVRLVGSISRSRKRVPCLVFDNADHFSVAFQEAVFQYARSIYEQEPCLVIVPVTDQTTWQVTRATERALQSFEFETLFLPTPPPRAIIQRRIEFVQSKVEAERAEPGTGYFIGRGIGLSLENLKAFGVSLQRIFAEDGVVAEMLSDLSNNNIRRCLELCKELVTSPHLEIDELLKAYIANSAIHVPLTKAKRAIIRGRLAHHAPASNSAVHNVFEIGDDLEISPLLATSILRAAADCHSESTGRRYMAMNHLRDYLRAMGVETIATNAVVQSLLQKGLCFSHNPAEHDARKVTHIEISPSGRRHLELATSEVEYLATMLVVTPIHAQPTYDRLKQLYLAAVQSRDEAVNDFVQYLLQEDRVYMRVPDQASYDGQRKLRAILHATGETGMAAVRASRILSGKY